MRFFRSTEGCSGSAQTRVRPAGPVRSPERWRWRCRTDEVVRVDRRKVLRTAVALGAVPLAACDHGGPQPAPATATTAPAASPPAPPSAGPTPAAAALPAEITHGPRDRT